MAAVLSAGLEAQGFTETASHGGWRRFAKFGRAGMEGEAFYAMNDGSLWHSAIRFTDPDVEVKGPILDRLFEAGCKAGASAGQARRPSTRITHFNADSALDELING